VLISYSVTGGNYWVDLTSVKTGAAGDFLAVWMPSVTGNYLIKAKWEGNSTIAEGSAVVNLALTPDSERNVFSVASNSTISEFAFNSTSEQLTFTASGPSGTTGHVSVYIPKSLIGDIADLRVYVDGIRTTYSSESLEDSWVLSFDYSHSVHKIVVELGAAYPPSPPLNLTSADMLTTYTIIAAVAAIFAVAAIVLRRRRANTPKLSEQMG
jgi:hypothetical protein